VDFSKSFNYVFRDPKWLSKIFIGGLWNIASLLFFGIPFVLGYFLYVVENTIKQEEFPLPFWKNLSGIFQKGVMLGIIYFAYCIPIILLSVLLEDSFGDSDALVLLLFMVVLFWLPIVTIVFAKTNDFMAAFKFEEMLNFVMNNIGTYVPMILLSLAVVGFSFSVGMFIAGIGIPFTSFWGILVAAHLFGQFGKKISASDDESTEVNV